MSDVQPTGEMLPVTQLKKNQWIRLKQQLSFQQQHIPYYKELFEEISFDPEKLSAYQPLRRFPVLTKAKVRQAPEKFLNPSVQYFFSSLSSGSTGEPFESRFDVNTWIRRKFLSKYRKRFQLGMAPFQKVAVLECTDTNAIAKMNRHALFTWPLLRIRYYSVFDSPDIHLTQLQKFRPHTLCGYPGHLSTLAAHAEANNAVSFHPSRIFTSSEYLTDISRNRIERVFSAPVYDHYGCAEFKEVAWQCHHRDAYHVASDEVYVEILSKRKQVLDCDAIYGELVITDLRNTVMPLTRYKTGDLAYRVKQCGCGYEGACIKLISGRSSEQLQLGKGLTMSPYRITTFMEQFPQIVQYQLEQKKPREVFVNTVWREFPNAFEQAKVEGEMKILCSDELNVKLLVVKRIPPEKNGKTPVLKQHLEPIPEEILRDSIDE